MLFVYDWRLALLCLIFPPISYICAEKMKKPVQRAGAAYKKAAGGAQRARRSTGRRTPSPIAIYGCEDAQDGAAMRTALDDYEKAAVRANVWQSALPPLYLAAVER